MRWVFIKPRSRSPYYDPELQEPLGVECLAAARRCCGDAVLVLDGVLSGADEVHLARRAASFRPDAVGFSLTTAQDLPSLRTIYAEYRLAAGAEVWWLAGGNFVSSEPDCAARLLPSPFVLVRGEGELALAELAVEWAHAEPPPAPGRRRVVQGRSWPRPDELPSPDRPFAQQILSAGWAFNVQGSRGCCGACRYCSSPGLTDRSLARWRGRSPGHIADELAGLAAAHGARAVNFVDEDFLGPPRQAEARALAFAAALRGRELAVSFSIQVRPVSLSAAAIDTLAEVGLTYVFMGLESDDRADFRRWGRPWSADPWQWVRRLRQRGVAVNVGSLMFHSHSTLPKLRSFATSLHQHGLLEYRSARNRLDAMPGSAFHTAGRANGQLDPEATGPQPLPFEHPEVERFYTDLLRALDPLGPPSMHALCALPPLLTACRFEPELEPRRAELERISTAMDQAVADTFFALLAEHEAGRDAAALVERCRQTNFAAALTGAEQLVAAGFAPSREELREAIRLDAGM